MDNIYSAYHYACKTKKDREAVEQMRSDTLEAAQKAVWGNVGDIKYTTRTDVPNGGYWCDGQTITKSELETVYQMLVDGKLQSVDIDTYNGVVSTNGSCGFFGLDTENQTFKVPTLTDVYIKSGQAAQTFGAESLPNFTYDVGYTGTQGNGNPDGPWDSGGAMYPRVSQYITIDPSTKNSAYKNGAKVNPDHVKYRAYVILFSGYKDFSIANFTNRLETTTQAGLSSIKTETSSSLSSIKSETNSGLSKLYSKEKAGISALANASNALRTTQVGPCVSEIPQNINYSLVDNKINLITGSKLYFPYGKTDLSSDYPKGSIFLSKFKVVSTYYIGGKFFLCVETMEDILDASQWGTAEKGLFIIDQKGQIRGLGASRFSSGPNAPSETNAQMWYDTANNVIKHYTTGSYVDEVYSFPIIEAMLSGNNDSKVTDIKKVFGGYSIIGQMMLVYPGAKILAPNRRNPDGTLNNIEYTVKGIITRTYDYTTTGQCVALSENVIWGAAKYVVSDDRPAISTHTYWYCPRDHVMRYCDSSTDAGWSVVKDRVVFAYNIITDSSYKITSMDFVAPFKALDYNDKAEIVGWGIPNYNAGVAISSGYTAPVNGFAVLLSTGGGNDSQSYMYVNGILVDLTTIRATWNQETSVSAFVKKGDVITVAYNKFRSFTFYPLIGG